MKLFALWAAVIVLGPLSQVFLKLATGNGETAGSVWQFYRTLLNGWMLAGLATAGLSFLLWMRILSQTRVSTAFNFSAAMYIVMALMAYAFLREPLTLKFCAGTALIAAGVWLSA